MGALSIKQLACYVIYYTVSFLGNDLAYWLTDLWTCISGRSTLIYIFFYHCMEHKISVDMYGFFNYSNPFLLVLGF